MTILHHIMTLILATWGLYEFFRSQLARPRDFARGAFAIALMIWAFQP